MGASCAAADWHRTAVIFYCDFSAERAPRLFRAVRNADRKRHLHSYPQLQIPHMCALRCTWDASVTPIISIRLYAGPQRHIKKCTDCMYPMSAPLSHGQAPACSDTCTTRGDRCKVTRSRPALSLLKRVGHRLFIERNERWPTGGKSACGCRMQSQPPGACRYILKGGYKAYHNAYPELCTPLGGYVSMVSYQIVQSTSIH